MKYVLIFVGLAVLGGGLFFVHIHYTQQLTGIGADPALASEIALQLLDQLIIVAIVATALLSLLVFSIASTRSFARRMAYRISKDLSFTRDQFRRFYELSPVPYLLIRPNGDIIRPNKASVRMFGLTEEELLQTNIFNLIALPENKEKMAFYKESVSRGVPIEQKEVQIQDKKGALRWALLSIENLEQHNANRQGLVTLVDIHEQKELERIKTEFLSLASHQLRAPLANLKWYIDFLLTRRTTQLTDEIQGYLLKMFHRNEDMIDLVNTLLNLSRIEMGRVQVERSDTDVTQIVRGIMEELEPAARDKAITLQTELIEGLMFNTDAKLVRIILQNLLTNALRYTPEGGKVFVRVQNTSHGVVFEVEDTGVGIPPEEQPRIFQKLYRASNAKQIEVNGNGIGLYMCKALAEALGGGISFQSKLGRGTVFTVDLPA
jgi:PAS domain S-box-containing protein